MRFSLIALFLIASISLYAQRTHKTDSVAERLCSALGEPSEGTPDSVRLQYGMESSLYPYLRTLKDEDIDNAWTKVHYSLLRNCPEYSTILYRRDEYFGDWMLLDSEPLVQTSDDECSALLERDGMYYIDVTGDTVKISMKDGLWIDTFPNGTMSKLQITEFKGCNFRISFIESTNVSRMNMSKPGDEYEYIIYDTKEDYYLLAVKLAETNQFYSFKLYY
ncbi:MAG: hypothetical protein AAFX87_12305 [Bacteroidota bacterium]